MAPLRIAFIGLSSGRSWASNAHLPYLKSTSKYKIVGLCNSSVEAAKAAKREHDLADTVKTYGSPEELAADPDVDLVVVSVRVDRHYKVVKPALEAGKACFVEWPLAANLQEGEELYDLAEQKGARTVVGLQARMSPVVNTVKELVESGRIGKVLSSTVISAAGNFGPTIEDKYAYFNDRKVGGNMVSIHFGHLIDYVVYTLGELSDFNSILSNQLPEVELIKKDSTSGGMVKKDTHDQIMLQGYFKSGAVLSIHQRGGEAFKGEPGLIWRIYGEKGELQITAAGSFLQIGYPDMRILLHDHASGEVEQVDWQTKQGAEWKDLPMPAQNVARLYEAYAEGKTDAYPEWDVALTRHKMLDELYRSSDEGRQGHYM